MNRTRYCVCFFAGGAHGIITRMIFCAFCFCFACKIGGIIKWESFQAAIYLDELRSSLKYFRDSQLKISTDLRGSIEMHSENVKWTCKPRGLFVCVDVCVLPFDINSSHPMRSSYPLMFFIYLEFFRRSNCPKKWIFTRVRTRNNVNNDDDTELGISVRWSHKKLLKRAHDFESYHWTSKRFECV